MNRQPHSALIAACLSALILPAVASADVVSGFSTDAEGWSVTSFGDLSAGNYAIDGTYAVTYASSGGNPGGYISSQDPDGGDFTFSAPAAFLGNVSKATGLSYSVAQFDSVNYQTTDVMLVGSNGTHLLWQSTTPIVTSGAWQSVSLSFAPSVAWHLGTPNGALATSADFSGVLGNLSGLYIRGEYAFGADNTAIDSVDLMGVAAVPEPASAALLAAGGLGLAAWTRRRNALTGS